MTEITDLTESALLTTPGAVTTRPATGSLDDLIHYYSEAGPDYAAWSPAFNMHFGFAPRFGFGFGFSRETMLERMNEEVLRRAGLGEPGVDRLIDLGCGLGATARHAVARFPNARVTGVTIVPWQVERARELAAEAPGGDRIEIRCANYQATGLPSKSFDAAYALESACHGEGAGKASLLREAHRLLRRGGRLVVADGFLKRPAEKLGPVSSRLQDGIKQAWVIQELGVIAEFTQELECAGFGDVQIEDLRWRVAPSALQIPWVTVKFLFTELLVKHSRMTRERWNNVLGPIYGLLLSLAGVHMSYYMISATKN